MLLRRSPQNLCYVGILAGEDGLRPTGPSELGFHVTDMFIEHGTRRMHLDGITANPTGEWTVQQARNLALTLDGRFEDIKFLIRDRGSNFTASFDAVFQATGARILRTAVQAPRMKPRVAYCTSSERLAGRW